MLAVLAVCLPVPVCATSGLSIPLPASVERLAVALVPWVETAALDVGDALARGARGAIVLASAETADSGSDTVLALGDTEAAVPTQRERRDVPELAEADDPIRSDSNAPAVAGPDASGTPKPSDHPGTGPAPSEEPTGGSERQPPTTDSETRPPTGGGEPGPPPPDDPGPPPPKPDDPVTPVVDEVATTVTTAVDDAGAVIDDTVDTIGGIVP